MTLQQDGHALIADMPAFLGGVMQDAKHFLKVENKVFSPAKPQLRSSA